MVDIKWLFRGAVWLGLYLALVFAPLFVLLLGPVPAGRGFWWEFSAATGYAGLSMMGIQFALTARFKRATAPFGIDIIYYFHRQFSVLASVLIVLHMLFLSLASPRYALNSLNPYTTPWTGWAALGGMACFGLILATSLWRKRLGIPYERWRLCHGFFAVTGVGHFP